jgi:AcrR family transcriptional regulator
MQTKRVTVLTTKGEETRDRILATALDLFTAKGYEQTTLRDIAATAQCSLGLTYRYFERKEDLVLALYERLLVEFEAEMRSLPPGSIASRYAHAMQIKLRQLAPYREAFGALFGAALTPHSPINVLGDRSAPIRQRASAAFGVVVVGATDAPRARQADDLAMLLYAAHFLIILFWLHDRTPDQRATADLLRFTRDTLGRFRPVLRLPPVGKLVARLAALIKPMFGGAPNEGL